MVVGLHGWWWRRWALPCSVLILGACTPLPSQLSPTALSAPPVTADVYGGAGVSGRVFALNQLLAREQARSEQLQAELDAARSEVQQLHEGRNAPAGDAMAATARNTGSQGNSAPAAPPAPAAGNDAAAALALIDDLRAQVAQERQRREAVETELAQLKGATVPASALAALHADVAQEQHRREAAETELARLRDETPPAAAIVALHAEVAQEQQRREAAERELARLKDETAPAAVVTALHAEVAQEQHRREAAETQLARLKEETSSPPLGQSDGAPAALVAAKQEVADLHRALDEERATRQRLAEALRALQEQPVKPSTHADGDGANAELRARLEQLEAEKQALVESFNRSLSVSQQHSAELEAQLQAAAGRGAAAGEVATVQAENAALRTRLDEEHRRTEALAAKLQLATRVTDLIFKMQAQQAQP
jgi:hypothetical protein